MRLGPGNVNNPRAVFFATCPWRLRVQQRLQGEPAHYQQIVQLRFVGETYQAIARKLHINERTVRRVLKRLVREKVA